MKNDGSEITNRIKGEKNEKHEKMDCSRFSCCFKCEYNRM